ncbi:MAG: biotin--[acetyl-CoA-carboxylase] ligase [Chloroflexi bacterium]|nr:biotin--[acetyl-CoA-carboxylase] ligase [Chloroflexota bacterium]
MDQRELELLLAGLPIRAARYFPTLGSTNDVAARWAAAGAPDLALVAADEQTAGRGRLQRRWLTPPGAALAFSVILRPGGQEDILRYTALGALAVCEAVNQALPAVTPALIKWPNDVLANRRKLAGVLAEAHWRGEVLQAVILGVGVNVARAAVPAEAEVSFPATCVEDALEAPVDRWGLLHAILEQIIAWRARLAETAFLQAWSARLAFRGEWVQAIWDDQPPLAGQVLGLDDAGRLRLRARSGEIHTLQGGELRLRPAATP